MGSFEIRDGFYLNGEKVKIISGGIHYFRVVPEYWRDRLEKIKALGCNTVETYVAWNMHEPEKDKFNFSGICDVKRFIKIAGELGLNVIVRPSPYICAEWEFGGIPGWVAAIDGMKLRCSYPPFIKLVEKYYKKLFDELRDLQITKGGPIIMFQVENEYGSYGNDTDYLRDLERIMRENGVEVPLFTSDGPWNDYLDTGYLPGVLQTANFGSKGHEQFKVLKKHVGENAPLMCAEFWVGWFDAWGDKKHNTGDVNEHVKDLDEILSEGSINIYMAHGGTNFGFMNGANYYDELKPDVTSYDYDALITEDGELTEKYHAFKKIIAKYNKIPEVEFTTKIKKKGYGKAELVSSVRLFDVLSDISEEVKGLHCVPMEKLGQNYGYILYKSALVKDPVVEKLRLHETADRAKVYLDEKELITLYDRELLKEYNFKEKPTGGEMAVLVENMGRVNYGYMMEQQQKGIKGGVFINGHHHFDWSHYCLPLDNTDKLPFGESKDIHNVPAFYKYTFNADEKCDTFIDMTGFGKGVVILNGFNLGRFWKIGPQKRLYVPAPLLKEGENTVIVFETEGKAADHIGIFGEPDLG